MSRFRYDPFLQFDLMPVDTKCTACGAALRLADKYAGKKIRCPKCKGVTAVPAAGEAAAKEENWYVQSEEGEQYGPIPKSELDEWVKEGRLTAEAQILREGADQWQWITDEYPDLEGGAAAAEETAAAPGGSPFDFLGKESSGGGAVSAGVKKSGAMAAVSAGAAAAAASTAAAGDSPRDPLAAALLGIFAGAWGVHRFYLGYQTMGIVQIIVTIVTCGLGAWWGIIEGFMILSGSFDKDAKGRKLRRQRF